MRIGTLALGRLLSALAPKPGQTHINSPFNHGVFLTMASKKLENFTVKSSNFLENRVI